MSGKYTLMKKPDFSKHGPHVSMMMANEGWTDADISDERKPVINPSKLLHTIAYRIEDLFCKERLQGKFTLNEVDVERQAIVFVLTGDERKCHDRADELVEREFGPENISIKRRSNGKHVYLVRRSLVKMNELSKDDEPLTLEVTDDLLDEATGDAMIDIPLGLNSSEHLARLVNDNIKRGDPSPMTILEDLKGQLSDGKWENNPRMGKYWLNMDFEGESGEVMLRTPKGGVENPFLAPREIGKGMEGDPMKVRTWLAKHLKALVQGEVGSAGWNRDNETELKCFSRGTTVAMVYAVYDILLDRPAKGKSLYYDIFKA